MVNKGGIRFADETKKGIVKSNSILLDKSKQFATKVVRLCDLVNDFVA